MNITSGATVVRTVQSEYGIPLKTEGDSLAAAPKAEPMDAEGLGVQGMHAFHTASIIF